MAIAQFNRVHVLIGSNGTSAIIGFYLNKNKIKQMYMCEKIPLKSWFPKDAKYWRTECKAKVTASRLSA